MSKLGKDYIIFPFPPIKNKKWLVITSEENQAKTMLLLLTNSNLKSPLEDPESYINCGIHQDGITPLFKLKEKYSHTKTK